MIDSFIYSFSERFMEFFLSIRLCAGNAIVSKNRHGLSTLGACCEVGKRGFIKFIINYSCDRSIKREDP